MNRCFIVMIWLIFKYASSGYNHPGITTAVKIFLFDSQALFPKAFIPHSSPHYSPSVFPRRNTDIMNMIRNTTLYQYVGRITQKIKIKDVKKNPLFWV